MRRTRTGWTKAAARAWTATVLTMVAATAAGAAEPRVQAELARVAAVGQTETLTVRLVGADGEPVPAPRDLAVTVTVEGEGRRLRAKLPAGAAELPLRLTARSPAAWTLEVVVEGLEPVWVPWLVVPAEAAKAAEAAEAIGSAARLLRRVTAPPVADRPLVHPAPPAATGDETAAEAPPAFGAAGSDEVAGTATVRTRAEQRSGGSRWRRLLAGAAEVAQHESVVLDAAPAPPAEATGDPPAADPAPPPPAAGTLRFHTPEIRVRPGSDGLYRRTVFVNWFVGDVPTVPAQAVAAQLRAEPDGLLETDPVLRLEVPPSGDPGVVHLVAAERGSARLTLLPGGESVRVELLPAEPRALRFVPGQVTELRRLGPGEVRVTAELLGDLLRPTLAPADLELRFTAVDGATAAECTTVVPAGTREGGCVLRLERFGDYEVWVRAGSLDPGRGQLAFGFDLALLAWVLAGGLLGAGVQVVRHSVRSREKRLHRYLIGAAAALVVVLLLAFGGLVWLDFTLPDGLREAAAGSSQSGLFLLGLLGGLAGDAVFAALDRRFRWTAGRGAAGGTEPAGGEPPTEGGGPTPAPAVSVSGG